MKSNREVRTNKFYFVSYCTKDFIQEVLNRKLSQIKCYAYILHDKDVYLADVFNSKNELLHRAGEKEIEHLHIYLELFSSRLPSEIVAWFKCFDNEGKLINTLRKYVGCSQSCVDYLTHKWDKEKYQYSFDEITSYGLTKLEDGSYRVNDEYDFTFDIIYALINGESLKTIIKRYGKDFVYHYGQFKDVVSDLLDYKKFGHDFRGSILYNSEIDGDLPF